MLVISLLQLVLAVYFKILKKKNPRTLIYKIASLKEGG